MLSSYCHFLLIKIIDSVTCRSLKSCYIHYKTKESVQFFFVGVHRSLKGPQVFREGVENFRATNCEGVHPQIRHGLLITLANHKTINV